MNVIRSYQVATQVPNWLHTISLVVYFHLKRLHSLLNSCAYFIQSCIYSCFSYTSLSSLLNCLQKVVIDRVECYCECTIYQMALHMGSKVYFADIIFTQNSLIPIIGSVMGRTVVDTAASRESLTCFKFVILYQFTVVSFYFLAEIDQFYAGFDNGLSVLSYLSVAFSWFPQHLIVHCKQSLFLPHFSIRNPLSIFILVLLYLSNWMLSLWILLRNRNRRRVSLLELSSLPVSQFPNVGIVLLSLYVLYSSCSSLLLL